MCILLTDEELDSDSDFNPGSYTAPQPQKRGRKLGGSRHSGEPPNKRRRKGALEGSDDSDGHRTSGMFKLELQHRKLRKIILLRYKTRRHHPSEESVGRIFW